jgi:predicted aspartyl protease
MAVMTVVVSAGSAAAQTGSDASVNLRIKDGCRMVVPVSINGRGPYDFLLDTGAAMTMVDERVAHDLGFRPMTRVRLVTFTGAPTMPMARVETISVGLESLSDMKVLYFDLRKLFSFGYGIRGVLGQDFLSRFNYLISYREKSIRFEKNGDLKSVLTGERLPSERNQSKYYVSVQPLGGEEKGRRFLLDSGALDPLVFAQPDEMPALDIVRFEEQALVARTAVGQRYIRPCRVGIFRIGEATLKNLRFMVADLKTGEKRYEGGLLPLCVFEAVYFNNDENYVILNPGVAKDEQHPPATAQKQTRIATAGRYGFGEAYLEALRYVEDK